MPLDTKLISDLKTLRAHAALTQEWADKILAKLENEGKPKRKTSGLAPEERARVIARRKAFHLKQQQANQ